MLHTEVGYAELPASLEDKSHCRPITDLRDLSNRIGHLKRVQEFLPLCRDTAAETTAKSSTSQVVAVACQPYQLNKTIEAVVYCSMVQQQW